MFQTTVANNSNVYVYKVQLYDVINDKPIISRRMATEAGAAKMGGHVIYESKTIINAAQLERGEEWTAVGFSSD